MFGFTFQKAPLDNDADGDGIQAVNRRLQDLLRVITLGAESGAIAAPVVDHLANALEAVGLAWKSHVEFTGQALQGGADLLKLATAEIKKLRAKAYGRHASRN